MVRKWPVVTFQPLQALMCHGKGRECFPLSARDYIYRRYFVQFVSKKCPITIIPKICFSRTITMATLPKPVADIADCRLESRVKTRKSEPTSTSTTLTKTVALILVFQPDCQSLTYPLKAHLGLWLGLFVSSLCPGLSLVFQSMICQTITWPPLSKPVSNSPFLAEMTSTAKSACSTLH